MNFISWLLALSTLIYLLTEAVAFQKATVCRQEAWLKSTELKTRALLHKPKSKDREWHLTCRLHVVRNQEEISWQRLPSLMKHEFSLDLKGQL